MPGQSAGPSVAQPPGQVAGLPESLRMPPAPPHLPTAPTTATDPTVPTPARGGARARARRRRRGTAGLFEARALLASFPEALRKLHPRALATNPVLFVVACGSVLTTLSALLRPSVFAWVISGWLWLTVVFANLAEAVAEGRGKAQADSLRKARTDIVARRLRDNWRVGIDLRGAGATRRSRHRPPALRLRTRPGGRGDPGRR